MNEDQDDMAVAEPLAGEELERVLARYARVRLDPGQAQARRARAAVMEEAWRRRITSTTPARRGLFAGWGARRVGASLSAAVLAGLLLGTSVFAASRAGGPLYEPRLALEELTLPSAAAARVDALLASAQTRLAEAVEAAGRHDDPATAAALAAYDRTIEALAGAEGDAAVRALEAVRFHRSVLLEVAAAAPAGAANGLAIALARSEHVIEVLAAAGPGTPGGAGNGGVPPGGGDGSNGAGGKPSPKPEATPKPEKTAKPARTEEPAAATTVPTVKPGRTPPAKTPDPDKPDATGAGKREAPGGDEP